MHGEAVCVVIMPQDYYKTLGVGRGASEDQIKRAYRRLAKQYHPDRNKGDKTAGERFKQVREAYEILSDRDKRAMYDRFGRVDVGAGTTPGARAYRWSGTGGPGGVEFDIGDLEDLFGQAGGGRSSVADVFEGFFRTGGRTGRGARGRRYAEAHGADVEHEVQLSFEQAIHGTVLQLTRTGPEGDQTIQARIPPGVNDGQRIRLRGRGQPGMGGGAAGDLYIICRVRPHRYFRREGSDIYLDLPIGFDEAALGAKVTIPTIDGPTTVTVPPATSSGTKLRLKGKGVRHAKTGQRGDQYAVVKIVLPKQLTERQRELFEQLRKTLAANPRQGLDW